MSFDARTHTARVQGTEIALHDANVLLVDAIDAPGGPPAIETRRIEPLISGPPVHIERWLGSSQELVEFLRCDAPLADPRLGELVSHVCAQIARR